jgi:hypothetical protein
LRRGLAAGQRRAVSTPACGGDRRATRTHQRAHWIQDDSNDEDLGPRPLSTIAHVSRRGTKKTMTGGKATTIEGVAVPSTHQVMQQLAGGSSASCPGQRQARCSGRRGIEEKCQHAVGWRTRRACGARPEVAGVGRGMRGVPAVRGETDTGAEWRSLTEQQTLARGSQLRVGRSE